MKNLIKQAESKAINVSIMLRNKAFEVCERTKGVMTNNEGQGTLDVAITVLISIVLGALILGGLYLIISGTVLPTITQKIKEMFNYQG
ncbi:hypothetical protein DesLBE_3679 [Desulfitobacterium sp. LBE]|uniref:DUF6133 family protein n=1 Tax=Desulfitobacterium sp. LBE TaxID=884086 RepID=UPI00119BE194|nr:DUF6133 family protein [Desulfitobacterium sp. LBE]TWH59304.1 hypothetical protein DesLBE_3679 [Desulfitobacterium sp. LBE]